MHLLAACFFAAMLIGLAALLHHLFRADRAAILAALRGDAPPRRAAVRAAARVRASVPHSRSRHAAA